MAESSVYIVQSVFILIVTAHSGGEIVQPSLVRSFILSSYNKHEFDPKIQS
jgi:hypothetical protein